MRPSLLPCSSISLLALRDWWKSGKPWDVYRCSVCVPNPGHPSPQCDSGGEGAAEKEFAQPDWPEADRRTRSLGEGGGRLILHTATHPGPSYCKGLLLTRWPGLPGWYGSDAGCCTTDRPLHPSKARRTSRSSDGSHQGPRKPNQFSLYYIVRSTSIKLDRRRTLWWAWPRVQCGASHRKQPGVGWASFGQAFGKLCASFGRAAQQGLICGSFVRTRRAIRYRPQEARVKDATIECGCTVASGPCLKDALLGTVMIFANYILLHLEYFQTSSVRTHSHTQQVCM